MPELVWDGKYGSDGRRAATMRVSLPFQTVETVNESAQDRQRSLDLFRSGRDATWRNRLIWGDKNYVLPSLLDEFAGTADLIYIDPPFDTGTAFSLRVHVDGEDFVKPAHHFLAHPGVDDELCGSGCELPDVASSPLPARSNVRDG
jgi:hypothetical protein